MADETIDLSKVSLTGLTEQAKEWIESLKKAGEHTLNLKTFTDKFGVEATNIITGVKNVVHDLTASFGSFTKEAEMATNLAKGFFQETTSIIEKSGLGVADLAIAFEPLVGLIDKNITGMGRLGDAGYEAGSKISTAFTAVSPLISNAFGNNSAATRLFSTMTDGASRAVGLRRELESMAISQGRLSSVMNEGHTAFRDMNEEYNDFAVMSVQAARDVGQTVGSIMDLTKALSSIPGSLTVGQLTVDTSRIAATAHRDQLVVAKDLSDMYTRLGTTQQDALANMANIHDKAGDSKLRMESFASTVHNVASNFKMLGDNTVAATTFVKAFDDAFKDSQISPEAMRDVISSIGDGIHRMDAGKKAFISASTGGPGGLAGAVQMDYAIQTGHVDEVIKKTMTAMQSQFGGQVVTLKDAAENPALAGEFYKQIQYLTQVSGIAKDEDQAKRILEAMKSGVVDNLKIGSGEVDKGNVLERHLEAGASLQEQTKNKLMDIHQTMEATRLRQDDIYHVMLVQNPGVLGMLEKAANAGGIELGPSSLNNENQESKHTGVRGFALPTETKAQQFIPQELSSTIGESKILDSVKSIVEKTGSSLDSMLFGLSNNQNKISDVKKPEVITVKDSNNQMQNRLNPVIDYKIVQPPPESTSRLPLIPPLQLPKTPNQIDSGKIGNAQLQMEHTFKPLTLEITGPGIKQLVQLELQEQKRGDLSQAATGLRL